MAKIAETGDKALFDLIQKIAHHGIRDPKTGAIHGTERTVGYVAKIHEDGELAGTVDVQEYVDYEHQEDIDSQIGYHEGVRLSALQNNGSGFLIRPKLYSEVVIVMDPGSGVEYVSMFSHVDTIQLDSHDKASIGVREREEFDINDDNGEDVDQLPTTGVQAVTDYTKDSITTTLVADKDGKQTVIEVVNGDGIKQTVGDDKSIHEVTQDKISFKHGDSEVILDDSQVKISKGNSSVTVEDGTVYVGSKGDVDDAVLGQELAGIFSDLLGYLSQMMTPTCMGPQAPTNVLPSFISLKAKIQAFAASHSGFLTSKVQIQK